jgi:exodeoxyribonuclease V beta subunit
MSPATSPATASTAARAFDPTAALPAGTVLLEASAGTGKTYSITSLVLRLVAEQRVPLDRVLIVTFTRAAAAELRGRVRERLTDAVAGFDRALAGHEPGETDVTREDQVLAHLVREASVLGAQELGRRRRLLAAAVERFDDATIDTIHGFCQRALQQAAPDVDLDLGAELTEDLGGLVEELVDDALVRELRRADPRWYQLVAGHLTPARLQTVARHVASEPDLVVVPDPLGEPPDTVWDRHLTRFRAAWEEQGAALAGWLADQAAAKAFQGRYYNRKRPFEEAERVDAWLAAGPERWDLADATKALTYFGRGAIEERRTSGAPIPADLDVVDAAEALLATPDRVVTNVLARFAADAAADLAGRKRARGTMTFSDLLVELDRALQGDPATREAVRTTLRHRYDVALIDEFQDTDPVQWRIFDAVFGTDLAPPDGFEPPRLYLIGDPKQAIYGFRGADVNTYLRAASGVPATRRFTLPVNHRSDARYLDALQRLFGRPGLAPDGAFATPGIVHAAVSAAERNREPRLRLGGAHPPALELRFVPRRLVAADADPAEDGAAEEPTLIGVGWARPRLARMVAAEMVELLGSGAEIRDRAGHWRPVEPRDLAVLVRTNAQAAMVQAALLDAGVPAVVGTGDSVFATPEATQLQRLLDALLRPGSDRAIRAALAGPILGVSATELADPDPARADAWVETFEGWAGRWHQHGIAAVLRTIMAEAGTAPRLLGRIRGERSLTNLLHLGEVLHVAETGSRLGPEGLTAWLRDRRHDGAGVEEEQELRLESDEDAVTVVTIHRAKGLQYPIVWCPFLWDGKLGKGGDAVLRFHDPATDRLTLDLHVDPTAPPKDAHVAAARLEEWRESLRLLYVALTRAEHRCVVHTGAFAGSGTSPLYRLLHGNGFATDDGSPVPPTDPKDRSDQELLAELHALLNGSETSTSAEATAADGPITVVEVAALPGEVRWDRPADGHRQLQRRTFERDLDRSWQRSSYSRLVSAPVRTDASGTGAVPDDVGSDDDERIGIDHDERVVASSDGTAGDDPTADPATGVAVRPASGRPAAPPPLPASRVAEAPDVPLADFPRGAAAGTFLHELLERLDFVAAGADAEVIRALVDDRAPRAGLGPVDTGRLVDGLHLALWTPLGDLAGQLPLARIDRADRLDELEFDLPIAGGYAARGRALTLARLAEVFDTHAGDRPLLAATAARLRARDEMPVRGFLTGSIDLVARIGDRYLVADYKSNWLGQPVGSPDGATRHRSTVYHYGPDRLEHAMLDHDYVLQEHLYLVALHRFLRWRLGTAYDYDRHVAGGLYLFLRGMVGPDAAEADTVPPGIHADRPPRSLIEALDAVLAGEAP